MEHAVPVVVSVTTFLLSLHQFHLWIMPTHFLHRILSCPLKTDCLDVLLRVRILQYALWRLDAENAPGLPRNYRTCDDAYRAIPPRYAKEASSRLE